MLLGRKIIVKGDLKSPQECQDVVSELRDRFISSAEALGVHPIDVACLDRVFEGMIEELEILI